MKKNLASTELFRNSKGFILPYFMLIMVLTLMVISSSVTVYINHIEVSKLEIEQMKLQTLIQMAHAELLDNLQQSESSESGQKIFDYPYGQVTAAYSFINSDTIDVQFYVISDKGGKRELRMYIKKIEEK
ncbi:competence type IV pilus minor pilin ComGG [Aquibacillus albus]|uniref:Competence protein ComG n=1 Tax=Aquibacillus albus TaxID=1168171 RepID=A0ABS2MUY0_9BACI|nr:competence type IV pilus minor pilin ComGG [Aquibacillus albus]MBM7569675.1 hypothetical protein [Aquibacillus albus]